MTHTNSTRARHWWPRLAAAVLGCVMTWAQACPGDGPAGKSLDLAKAEAADPRWLRDQIGGLLPCRDDKSQLACMCRPVVEVDIMLPLPAIEQGRGPKARKATADARRRLQSLRRALNALGDVGNVQLRLEYRTTATGKIVLSRPAEIREARRVLRIVTPRSASQTVVGFAPARGKKPTSARQHVLRVTFV